MVNRVLIGDMNGGLGAADMRIRGSRPGYDVLSALAPEQLSFDSAWLDTAVIYMTGTVFVGTRIAGGYVQVNFPDTLPSLPQVIFWRKLASNVVRMGSDKSTNTGWIPEFCRFSTTYLRFQEAVQAKATTGPEPYTAAFIVLRGIN